MRWILHRRNTFSVLLSVIIVAKMVSGCTGYDPDVSGEGSGFFEPDKSWAGSYSGLMVVRDRNRSVLDTATVERNCVLDGENYTVDCSEERFYHRRSERRLADFSCKYNYRQPFEVDLECEGKDGFAGKWSGEVYGSSMFFTGSIQIPLDERSMNARMSYINIPPADAVIESIEYRRLGIIMGYVETYYRKD